MHVLPNGHLQANMKLVSSRRNIVSDASDRRIMMVITTKYGKINVLPSENYQCVYILIMKFTQIM